MSIDNINKPLFSIEQFFSQFPILQCGKIRLRQLLLSDSQEYFNLMAAPEVHKYLSDEDVPTSIMHAAEEVRFWGNLFNRKQTIFWAITLAASDKLIGTIGFNAWNFHNRRAEISYELSHHYWRRGIMSNVLRHVIPFAFNQMNLNRLEAKTMLGNTPSQLLLNKMGFQQEGCARQYRFIRGEPIDVLLYAMLRSEYTKQLPR